MSDYGDFNVTQRKIEMEKEEESFRVYTRREKSWRRKQMAAEVTARLLGAAVAGLVVFGAWSILTHVWVMTK